MATFQVDTTIITFRLLLDGADINRQATVNVRHIPAGDNSYVDLGGLEAPSFKCRAKLDSYADLISLQAMAGQSGILAYSEAVFPTAILRSVSQSKAIGANAQRLVALDFLLVI